jgi:hypothetical protein
MATYGSRDKNLFRPSTSLGKTPYYVLVESDGPRKGEITIKSPAGLPSSLGGTSDTDRTIGIIPLDNSFRTIEGGVATKEEVTYFSTAAAQKIVKNQAVRTAQNAGAQNAQQLIFPNSATPGAGQGQNQPPVAATPAAATAGSNSDKLTEAENNYQIESKDVRTQYGNMIYPFDLRSQNQKQDVVKFTMVSYGGRKIEGLRLTQREFNKDKQINGSVVLGIQPRISDSNSVRWNEQNMDVLSIGLAGASLNTIEGGFTGTKESITQIGQAFQQEGSNVTGALKIFFAQEAAKTQNLLSRLQGGILNPNLELLFESPELRTFNYSFQLSPRGPKEAEEVRRIIRFFKQGMAVQRSVAELFLKAPNVFEIKYLLSNGQRDHPYLNRIKRCALVNCGVDYTPTGSYMTFAGAENSMVTYNLSLTFRELEPIYADDYDSTTDFNQIKNIGF